MIDFLNGLAELTNIGLLAFALFVAAWAIVFALVLTVRAIFTVVTEKNVSLANRRRSVVRGTLAEAIATQSEVHA